MRTELGERLRKIRGPRNQSEVADQFAVSLRTYASYERGERVPDAEFLHQLHQLGWDANWLLTGQGEPRWETRAAAESQSVGLTSGNVQRAAEVVALALEMLELEADPSAIGEAVVALARWADAQDAAKLRVADLLRRAKTILTTGSTTDEQ